MQELATTQFVIEQAARPYFRKLDYDVEGVIRYWPMGREAGIVLDPNRSFGKPIDCKSGVPTLALYEMVRAGESKESVANWYEVPLHAVEVAIEYETSLLAA